MRLDVPTTVTTKPAGGVQIVDLTAAATASNVQFGFFRRGTVSGVVFNDKDGSGSRNAATEPVIANFQLFLDEDGDQFPDDGEPTVTTDGAGAYRFADKVGPSFPFTPRVLPRAACRTDRHQFRRRHRASVSSGGSLSNQNLGIFTKGTVRGKVFEDVNGSGAYEEAVDRLLAGRSVRIFNDSNNDNQLTDRELFLDSRTTDGQGNYEFLQAIPAGIWKVTHLLNSGWMASLPGNNAYPILVSSGSTFSNEDFGAYLPASIGGIVFEDLDGNGPLQNGPRLGGWNVFLDLNFNGQPGGSEPLATTSSKLGDQGEFTFDNLRPGIYRVREIVQPGFVAGNPSGAFRDVTVTSGQAATDAIFANYRLGSISGSVFDDFDGDGLKETGEASRAIRTVYLDTNGDGDQDTGETSGSSPTSREITPSAI